MSYYTIINLEAKFFYLGGEKTELYTFPTEGSDLENEVCLTLLYWAV